tara:strand:- start:549 stop:1958 length:1410 start_codon:yes stop_codon:yes gene_type:complete
MKEFYSYQTTISPQKKKKLGIIYTPMEVVDYINTLILSEWQSKKPPKVLDPCCGTGVFLFDMATKIAARWGLSIEEVYDKYIYGIDVDEPAVEICKTNLPGANIICANSLKEDYSFCDLIVTNPPYVRIQNLTVEQTHALRTSYEFCGGDTDLYIAFFEKLAKCGKRAGMICPNSWIRNKSAKPLRNYLFDNRVLSHLVDFRDTPIFAGTQVYTSIVILSEDNTHLNYSHDMEDKANTLSYKDSSVHGLFVGECTAPEAPHSLLDLCDIKIGLATLCDGIYFGEVLSTDEQRCMFKTKYETFLIEKDILTKCVKASKISQVKDNTYIIFPYDKNNKLLKATTMESTYPLAFGYLSRHKERLLSRDKGKIPPEKWFGYGRTQGLSNNKEKLLVPPLQKGALILRYSSEEELYISGYAVVPKKGYDISTIRTYFEDEKLFSWVQTNGKTMRDGWIGISKEVFKNYRLNLNG